MFKGSRVQGFKSSRVQRFKGSSPPAPSISLALIQILREVDGCSGGSSREQLQLGMYSRRQITSLEAGTEMILCFVERANRIPDVPAEVAGQITPNRPRDLRTVAPPRLGPEHTLYRERSDKL
jgi:hypothetical protein